MWSALDGDVVIAGQARSNLRKGLAAILVEDETLAFDVGNGGLCCGVLLGGLGRWREAEAWYRQVLNQRPDDVVLRRQLGDVLLVPQE